MNMLIVLIWSLYDENMNWNSTLYSINLYNDYVSIKNKNKYVKRPLKTKNEISHERREEAEW